MFNLHQNFVRFLVTICYQSNDRMLLSIELKTNHRQVEKKKKKVLTNTYFT